MNVLHINCNYIGTSLHQTMIEHLGRTGIESLVYVPTFDSSKTVIEVNNGVIVSECFRKWDRLVFDYKQKKILTDLENNISPYSFDCIHAYTLFSDGNCAMKLSKKYGIPYVTAVRNTDVYDFFRCMPHLRGRGVEIMRNASAVFFLSPVYRDQVLNQYVPEKYRAGIKKKCYVIPNGIDDFWIKNIYTERDIRKKGIQGKKIHLIYAGRIDRNKNIATSQKAVSILRKRGYEIELTVVGKIIDKNVYRKVISDSHTRYVSALPKEKLINLYRESDIFIMPSFHETFGLVYAEAMSQGLPVIYTKGQGFDGQFEEGKVGYHIHADAAEEAVSAVELILKDYEKLCTNALKSTVMFRWEQIVKRYQEIYYSLLNENK